MADLTSNLKSLDQHLARFRQGGITNQIAGEAVAAASGATFETRSPVDGSLICTVARSDSGDIDRAAGAANAAFPEWRAMPGAVRRPRW